MAAADPQGSGDRTGPQGLVPPLDGELVVEGTSQLSFFKAGGKSPDSATLKLTGGAIELAHGTAFKKGDTITGTFTAIVREVGQRDKEDSKTGHVVSCKQKHEARITDLRLEEAKG